MKIKMLFLFLLFIIMPLVNSISVVDISSTEALYNYTESDPLSYHTDENINATGYNISADKITSYGNNVASYELTKEGSEVTLKWIK